MKIKHKLLIAFGLLIIFSFTIVGINLLTYQTMQSDSNFVNHAGKLRATSYKMAQLANVLVNSKDEVAIDGLKENISVYDSILYDISEGNDKMGLTKLTHEDTKTLMNDVVAQWNNKYKLAYLAVIESGDISALKIINEEVEGYVNSINEMVTGYSEYSSTKVAKAKVTNGILSIIALIVGSIAFIFLNNGIRKPVNSLIFDLKAISEGNGDLTKRIVVKGKDEIAEMTNYFNKFIESIQEIVKEILKISMALSNNMNGIAATTEELTKSTEMIASSSIDVAEGSMHQNNKIDSLNDLVIKIEQDIDNVSQKALQTFESSQMTQDAVLKGGKQMDSQKEELDKFVGSIKSASNKVEELKRSSEEIRVIVDLIHSISSQTNLLALNASIEAARAGEAGKGFAVVADEIRKLAEETSVSAKKINDIVIGISNNTGNVKTSMDDLVDKTKIQEYSMELLTNELKQVLSRTEITLGESREIMEITTNIHNEFTEITYSSKDIQNVAEQNAENTQDVASAVEEQTASFEEVSASINSINEMAEDLNKIVGRFRI